MFQSLLIGVLEGLARGVGDFDGALSAKGPINRQELAICAASEPFESGVQLAKGLRGKPLGDVVRVTYRHPMLARRDGFDGIRGHRPAHGTGSLKRHDRILADLKRVILAGLNRHVKADSRGFLPKILVDLNRVFGTRFDGQRSALSVQLKERFPSLDPWLTHLDDQLPVIDDLRSLCGVDPNGVVDLNPHFALTHVGDTVLHRERLKL